MSLQISFYLHHAVQQSSLPQAFLRTNRQRALGVHCLEKPKITNTGPRPPFTQTSDITFIKPESVRPNGQSPAVQTVFFSAASSTSFYGGLFLWPLRLSKLIIWLHRIAEKPRSLCEVNVFRKKYPQEWEHPKVSLLKFSEYWVFLAGMLVTGFVL